MRLLARGEASLYGAIVMSIILVIFASLYSVAVVNLARQGEIYREAFRTSLEASRERIEFHQDSSGSIYAYSNTDSRIIYLVIANSSSILNSSRTDIDLSPGVSVPLLSGDLAGLVSRGSAYLVAFTSRGNVFIYRGELSTGSSSRDSVSSDLWASPLLAIARQMPDMVCSSGTCMITGDEGQGQIRVTFARSISIGYGAVLYTANVTPYYENYYPDSGMVVTVIKAAGGVGVTRIIMADTIIVNGTLSSKGLGGAGNRLSCLNITTPYYSIFCTPPPWYRSVDLQNGGAVSSAGGGGYGRGLSLGGGSASLYGYTAPGGSGWQSPMPGGSGATIPYGALIKTLLGMPSNSLPSTSFYGAGGGSGGAGYAAPDTWSSGGPGGRGGGGIVVICNRLVLNNGVIDASGEDGGGGPSGSGGGGGGGAGAIFIYCNSVEGSGVIKALGGSGGPGNDVGKPGGRGGDGWVVVVTGYISPGVAIDVGKGYRLVAPLSG